ncbi:MAG: hypothetical protein GX456_17475 [Verrucomicrobia bacterium]|nr:hypothetical protein [Verrucomicrobiota bacterium]
MSSEYTWWAELRHGGCLITPARLTEHFPESPDPLPRHLADRLRREITALEATSADRLAALLDTVLEIVLDLRPTEWKKASAVPADCSIRSVSGEVIRPRRLWREPNGGVLPVFVDAESAGRLGVGRGRRAVARVNEWLRKKPEFRIALLTNGSQWRLIHAGQDYDAWCEWDSDLWFSEGKPSLQVTALRTLLGRQALAAPAPNQHPPLVAAILDSRKGQSELSAALGERVRQAVELLIGASHDAIETLESPLPASRFPPPARKDIYIAAVRLIMRCVVVLFAEARDLLPRNNPIYHSSYGIQGLREQLERDSGGRGHAGLRHRVSAWPRLLALFRLICDGSEHEALPIMRYGGGLFRLGQLDDPDPVLRALSALESPTNEINDATVAAILDCLTRAPIRVRQGRAASIVHAPVDFSQLDTEYIGILYQGLLDYELRKAERVTLFLNIGDQPALPLDRLEAMDDTAIANLVEKMAKSTKLAASSEESEEEEEEFDTENEELESEEGEAVSDHLTLGIPILSLPAESPELVGVLRDENDEGIQHRSRALSWARRAVIAGNLVTKPRGNLTEQKKRELQDAITNASATLVSRIIAPGEYFLVRWGGTRKGTGTFYTKAALAGPTVRRALEPLCYDTVDGHKQVKKPAAILALKVADIAAGSGSFLIAALRYLTDALYESLFAHHWLKTTGDGRITLENPPEPIPPWLLECTRDLPLNTDDPERAIKARLRRIIVERCIYGVDLDPLAVELCRLSLWIETMDYQLPFSFLDHKIKVGNALVGCWFDRFQDYPAMAWVREGGDKNHTNFVHHFREYEVQRGKMKGERKKEGDQWTEALKRFKDDVVKRELKLLIEALDPARPRQLELLTEFRLPAPAPAIHQEAVDAVRTLHKQRLTDPDAQARAYAEHFQNNPHIQTLRRAFDTWCAVWFWPADKLNIAPSPAKFFNPPPETLAVVEQLRDQHRFFHWEIEFPDVFDQPGAGFDSILGNPPWEIQKPNSKEWFSNIDPLYRTYGKQEAIAKQREYFGLDARIERDWLAYNARLKALSNWTKNAGQPFGNEVDPDEGIRFTFSRRPTENEELHALWLKVRGQRSGYADASHPFLHQGSADINTYKMFLEQAHALLRVGGLLGCIVPSGLYTDRGSTDLRRLFLDRCQWRWLFSFENRDGIFDIHRSFKFCPVIVQKGGQTQAIRATFMRRDLADWEQAEQHVLLYPRERVEQFSPKSRAILEIRSARDLEILQRMYANGVLLGDDGPDGWGIRYACEFHMTNDSKLFPPRPKWEEQGYMPDEYGHWLKGKWREIADFGLQASAFQPWTDTHQRSRSVLTRPPGLILSRDGLRAIRIEDIEDVALPLYEGRMIGQFDFSQKGWVSGKGRSAVWREIPWTEKVIEPQFMIGLKDQDADYLRKHLDQFKERHGKKAAEAEEHRLQDGDAWLEWRIGLWGKLGFMDVSSATNTRTFICTFLEDEPCGNKVPILRTRAAAALATVGDSFASDFQFRSRLGGLTLNFFIVEEAVLPSRSVHLDILDRCALSLAAPSTRFAIPWTSQEGLPRERSWRSLWAITPHERLRLRCIVDAVVAHLYGLTVEDFAWIMRDCDHPLERMRDNAFTRSLDPKGFWRVDKDKTPELRHTVLAQVAFQDLQRMGLEAFLAQNGGEGWMLPDTLRLSDYGLGHDDRAEQPQPVAPLLGPRFLPWQLNEDVAQSWEECRRHAENIRAIRSRFAPGPAAAPVSTPATPPAPSKPPALDLLGQPIPTDLFGNELPPQGNKRRR